MRRKRVAGRCGSSRNPGRKRTGSSSDTPVGIAGQAQASPPSPTAACVESLLLLPRHRRQSSTTNGRNVGGRVLPGGRLAAAFRAPGTGLADPDVMAANPRGNARGAFRLAPDLMESSRGRRPDPNDVQQAYPADRPASRRAPAALPIAGSLMPPTAAQRAFRAVKPARRSRSNAWRSAPEAPAIDHPERADGANSERVPPLRP